MRGCYFLLNPKKMKRLNFSITLILLFTGTRLAICQPIPVDTALHTGKLSNGLTYYIRRCTIPKGVADFFIVQKVGSILELDNQRGLAHFLEHEAFNGTVHFPGTSLIDEMEKKGIKFGSNINAYTSFDQTVYNLTHVPMNREGILDTTLLILHDWSGEITNYDKDIDEERKIIHEEWRTRSSAGSRMVEKDLLPTLLEGTPYAHRLPIGTMEVVDNFKPQELKDYYKKWYRPDLQAIIVVGDVDPAQVLAKLTKLFQDIPAPVNPAKREYVKVPDNATPIVAISSDPEFQGAQAAIYWKQDDITFEQRASKAYFKRKLINNILCNMMSERLSVAHDKKGSPIKDAITSMGNYSYSLRPSWNVSITAADTGIMPALKDVLVEIEKMHRYGFSLNEYEPTIRDFNINNNESDYRERDTRQTFMLTDDYIKEFLENKPAATPEWIYNTKKEILAGLTMDTLNFYAKKLAEDRNMAFQIALPSKAGVKIPTKQEVLALWDEVKKMKLKPYVKEVKPIDADLVKTPKAGKIIKIEKATAPFGYDKWVLSNGVNVLFKHTSFDEPNIIVYGYKKGGYSLVSLEDLPTAVYYNSLSQFEGFRGFEGKVGGNFSLEKNAEVINTGAAKVDMKLMFKYIYLGMTDFKKKPEAFDNWKTSMLESLKGRYSNPNIVFRDTITSIIRNHNPWALNLNDSAVIQKVNYDKVITLHKQRFGDARGFTFVITGQANEDSLKRLVETWLGGLPSTSKEENVIDHGTYIPKGVIKRHIVEKMGTQKSTVVAAWSGSVPNTLQNQLLMSFTTQVLTTIYLESIREKEGGTYGVGVVGQIDKQPKEQYILQVVFDTDPDSAKKQKLIGIVYDEIKKLQDQGPDKALVEKIRTSVLAKHAEQNKREDSEYWSAVANAYVSTGVDWRTGYKDIASSITPEQIRDFARVIFSQGNLIEVVMDPAPKPISK